MDPTWSPDGRSIAFSSDRDGTMDLWVRDVESGADKKVATEAIKASWAPRGSEIAYINRDGALAVTGRSAPVHAPMLDAGRPTWAPEGLIAITTLQPYSSRFREGTNQLVLVSTTGAADRQLNPVAHRSIGTRKNDGPVWSRDGSKMAFVMDGVMHVMPTTPAGDVSGAPRKLSDDLANSPSWAADSRRLLYQTPTRPEAGRRQRQPHHRRSGQSDVAPRPSRRAASSCTPAGCSTASPRRCAAASTS